MMSRQFDRLYKLANRVLALTLLCGSLGINHTTWASQAAALPAHWMKGIVKGPTASYTGQGLPVLRLEGRLTPFQFVRVGPFFAARAAEMYVQEGEEVRAGQVLIRSDQYAARQAGVASAELELRRAELALEDLQRRARLARAEAGLALAQAQDEYAFARDHFQSLSAPVPQERIDQAYANLLLAEKRLDTAHQDLAKVQKRYANKGHIIWRFINQRQFRLLITLKEEDVAYFERRAIDAQDKYTDLLKPKDEVDLAQAEARLAAAESILADALRRRAELQNGPNPDELELAQTHLAAAQAGLASAQAALAQAEIVAPIAGQVVSLEAKPGEWMAAGAPVVVLADLSRWKVETTDLRETDLSRLQSGQSVGLVVQAFPELSFSGQVQSIDLAFTEEDGDIYYGADISVDELPSGLRWGMTVEILTP